MTLPFSDSAPSWISDFSRVRYSGTGESAELLEAFEPEAFVDAIVSKTVGG